VKNFYTGLMTYFNAAPHNAFYTDIGGRLYDSYDQGKSTTPCAVYQQISARQADTFTETMDEILLQFTIFSTNSSSSEIRTAMVDLKALFDNCTFAVTGATIVEFTRLGEGSLIPESRTTVEGLQREWSYDVEYNILLRKT
jgi:hypothetical protein